MYRVDWHGKILCLYGYYIFSLKLFMMCQLLESNFLVLCRFDSPAAVPFGLVVLWCCVRTNGQWRHNQASKGLPYFLTHGARRARRASLWVSMSSICLWRQFLHHFLGSFQVFSARRMSNSRQLLLNTVTTFHQQSYSKWSLRSGKPDSSQCYWNWVQLPVLYPNV